MAKDIWSAIITYLSSWTDGRTDGRTDGQTDGERWTRVISYYAVWLTSNVRHLYKSLFFVIKLLAKSCNFIKKEILALVFFCDFFNNTFFIEQLWWLLLNLLSCSRIQTFYFPEKGFALSLQNYFLKVSSGI